MSRIDRTKEIQDKYKWEVNNLLDKKSNRIPEDNGYFGSYTLITYRRKQAIVFVDDRNAKVKVISGWFDKIFYGREYNSWSGDYRWNSDKHIVVMNKKMFNVIKVHTDKLLLEKWLPCVQTFKFNWSSEHRDNCLLAEDENGNAIYVMSDGSIINPNKNDVTLDDVKKYTLEQIKSDWIEKNKPCAHIHGLEFKGARAEFISQDKAREMIKTHSRFSGMFHSAEWRMLHGKVTLLFRDYCDSDYD